MPKREYGDASLVWETDDKFRRSRKTRETKK
jgi:hypothetical protein